MRFGVVLGRCVLAAAAMGVAAQAASAGWLSGPVSDSLDDAALEQVLRTAYSSARDFALSHGNYFARDGVDAPLRDAVTSGLAGSFASVAVPAVPTEDEQLRTCLASSGTELRIGLNSFGDGLTLAAVTNQRVFVYHYDPHDAATVEVTPATECTKP